MNQIYLAVAVDRQWEKWTISRKKACASPEQQPKITLHDKQLVWSH